MCNKNNIGKESNNLSCLLSLGSAAVRYQGTIRWACHLYLAVSVQRVRIMHHTQLNFDSEIRFYVVDNSVPLLLLLKLESKIWWQIDQA